MTKDTAPIKRDRRYWRNLIAFAILCLVIAFLLIQFIAVPSTSAYRHSHPQRRPVCCDTPADHGLQYQDVAITTDDNLVLRGWFLPSKNGGAVILLHGLGSNRRQMMGPAKELARHGFGVLLLDMRMHGESEGDVYPYGGPEVEDVRAAVAYLQDQADVNPQAIGIMGWSLGAQVSILSAALIPEIRSVIADGPGAITFDDWHSPQNLEERLYVPLDRVYYQVLPMFTGVRDPLSLTSALPQISPRSILMISSGLETEQHRLEHLYQFAQDPRDLWIIPQAGHIGGWRVSADEYKARMVDFFSQTLLVSVD